jgi:hypothetical protein
MNTYVAFNIATMKQIIAAVECLPPTYALRNEGVRAVGMEDDKLVFIKFAAMSMSLVKIPALDQEGWQIEGSGDIWLDLK